MARELFISLVSKTTPNGYEYLMYEHIPNPKIDQFGNRYVIVGDGLHKHLFTCHLDTYPLLSISEEITIIEDENIIRTDGSTLLGADDKAGMTVMLTMIQAGVPGIYGFFLAEEIGLLGSEFAAGDSTWQELMKDVKYAGQLQKVFGDHGINLEPDDTGSSTDSLSFFRANKQLQCTNISVGYGNAHSNTEFQDISYLELLCNAVIHMTWPLP